MVNLHVSMAYWTAADHYNRSPEIVSFCGVRGAVSHDCGHVCQGREVTAPELGPLCGAFHLRFCVNRGERGQCRVTEK